MERRVGSGFGRAKAVESLTTMAHLPRRIRRHDYIGYLEINSGRPPPYARFELFADTGRVIIGRDASCDLCFDTERTSEISRRHACLEVTLDAIYLEDLGSSNGTWVNGSPLAGRSLLRHGDVVSLGRAFGANLRLCLDPDESQRNISKSTDSPPTGAIPLGRSLKAGGISGDDVGAIPSDLVHSWLGVDAPVELPLGATGLVRAVAIRDALKEALVRGALSQHNKQLLSTLLGPAVKMRLVACNPQDFQIQPLTPSKQRVRGNKLSVWEWLITACEPGDDKVLLLTVSSLTKVDGARVGESMPSRQLRIRVVVVETQESLIFPTSGLRKLLQAMLRTDVDFEGFCLDYFPSVHQRFSNGMDRVAKLNLLLTLEKGPSIAAALKHDSPTQFAEHAPDCALNLSAPSSQARAQNPRAHAAPSGSQQHQGMALLLPSPDFPLSARESRASAAQRLTVAIVLLGAALAAGFVGWLIFKRLGH